MARGLSEMDIYRFGYKSTQREDATKRFLKFSEVMGVDATEAVRLVARALENSGENMDNYGDLLDGARIEFMMHTKPNYNRAALNK